MIIAVGFKVNNERAVQFRKWVNSVVKDYTIKGWVMDDERLKRGTYLTDKYFEEQLERIREIRVSERKFYQKITDIYATAIDYDKIKHFRVDKMLDISLSEEKRIGKEWFEKLNLPEYTKKHFGMFDGEEQTVKLFCKNEYAGVIIDRFGKDVVIREADKMHFYASVDVAVSGQFLGWIIGLGEGIQIVGPPNVCKQMLGAGIPLVSNQQALDTSD